MILEIEDGYDRGQKLVSGSVLLKMGFTDKFSFEITQINLNKIVNEKEWLYVLKYAKQQFVWRGKLNGIYMYTTPFEKLDVYDYNKRKDVERYGVSIGEYDQVDLMGRNLPLDHVFKSPYGWFRSINDKYVEICGVSIRILSIKEIGYMTKYSHLSPGKYVYN